MKYNRTYNFSAGPAMMPEPVLEEIRDEMMNYRGSGMCVMEMSHRSKVFQQIVDEAEADLRDLMGIPDNYKVLFIQGGATLQFAAVPWNLMKNGKAVYVETGAWSMLLRLPALFPFSAWRASPSTGHPPHDDRPPRNGPASHRTQNLYGCTVSAAAALRPGTPVYIPAPAPGQDHPYPPV